MKRHKNKQKAAPQPQKAEPQPQKAAPQPPQDGGKKAEAKAATSRPTLDQRRARHAWRVVESVKAKGEEAKEDFARQAKKLPLRIRTAGLGHALAFVREKKEVPGLLEELGDWVRRCRDDPDAPTEAPAGETKSDDALLKAILQGDAAFQKRATREVLDYLQWLNRFAGAELKGD